MQTSYSSSGLGSARAAPRSCRSPRSRPSRRSGTGSSPAARDACAAARAARRLASSPRTGVDVADDVEVACRRSRRSRSPAASAIHAPEMFHSLRHDPVEDRRAALDLGDLEGQHRVDDAQRLADAVAGEAPAERVELAHQLDHRFARRRCAPGTAHGASCSFRQLNASAKPGRRVGLHAAEAHEAAEEVVGEPVLDALGGEVLQQQLDLPARRRLVERHEHVRRAEVAVVLRDLVLEDRGGRGTCSRSARRRAGDPGAGPAR